MSGRWNAEVVADATVSVLARTNATVAEPKGPAIQRLSVYVLVREPSVSGSATVHEGPSGAGRLGATIWIRLSTIRMN